MQLSLILQSLCEIRTRMISIFLEKKQKLRGTQKLPQVTQLINGGAGIWICGVELQSPVFFSSPNMPICFQPQDLCTFFHLSLCNISSHSFTSVFKFQVERSLPQRGSLTGSLCGSSRFSEPLPTLCTETTFDGQHHFLSIIWPPNISGCLSFPQGRQEMRRS